MRLLVLSDVHGNSFGLAGVLEHARDQYDELLCLGDVVGYGAHPNECCELLREHDAHCLLGNHDAAALGLIDTEWFNPIAKAAIEWTRDKLKLEHDSWLRSLESEAKFPQYHFQAVHGSLREPLEEYIVGAHIAAPNLDLASQPLCWFGHTHVAVWYRAHKQLLPWKKSSPLQGGMLLEGGTVELEKGYRYLVNPGSCGQPRDGNRQARYALFDTDTRSLEVRAIDYDWEAARAAIIAAGLPPVLGDRLLQGH